MTPDLTLKIVATILATVAVVALFAVAAPLVRGALLLLLVLGGTYLYHRSQK
jgi:hypothetical protein